MAELEVERWQAHGAAHQRDRETLEKAAADVKQALEKAAGEVDRRLGDIRETYQSLLNAHTGLHASDREALVLARLDIDRRLTDMNQLRDQINNERGRYVERDALDDKLTSMEVHVDARTDKIQSELKLTTDKIQNEQAAQNRRLNDLEKMNANMAGKFAVLAGVLAFGVVVLQFIAAQLVR